MPILLLFLDGVGLGRDDIATNPLSQARFSGFERLAGSCMTAESAVISEPDHVFRPIDATLGVDGLPQSGTGQATLFTGINSASLVGRHFGPYAHSATRETIREFNIFSRIGRLLPDRDAASFANAYPERFFAYAERAQRWTVTTQCCVDAGLRIRGVQDLRSDRAVAADLTRERFHAFDDTVAEISERDAGAHLVSMAERYQFTLFEYYLTDKAGHSRSISRATNVLTSFDRALESILDAARLRNVTVLMTSDHGNVEDLSIKTHTRNPVPLAAIGPLATYFDGLDSLVDVTPAVIRALSAPQDST